ncbi:MAG: 30S ribosomal protein S7 [Phycisphaeraceae bacterium]|nr:MAG: 30S ribosomal protein S7 [Phycisphaeraceae bacterium]
MAGRITMSEDQLRPDPVYNDKVLAKFINCIMHDGKKSVAQRVMYDAIDLIDKRLEKADVEDKPENGLAVFHMAIENAKPFVEVRSKRIGGANYQVPIQVNRRRQQSLAFRWIIQAARGEKGRPMAERLADELIAAAKGEGKAMMTRDQTHRMAEANKAFSHFAR